MWTAFVTGCSSGFGLALARRLLSLGHRVVATDEGADAGWRRASARPKPELQPVTNAVHMARP